MKLSVVIPAYNEEKTIGKILEKVNDISLNGTKKEIIVVDDGSKDKTWEIANNLKTKIKELVVLRHKTNYGKGAAVKTGIERSTGDVVLIQDADLEYDPKDIPRLLETLKKNSGGAVYGTRLRVKPIFFGKKKTPFLLHFFGNKFLSLATTALYGHSITDMETGYKMFKKDTLSGISLKSKSFDFEPEITAKILKKGIRIQEIDIKTNPRTYEEGKKINTFRDGFKAVWTLVKYKFAD